MGHYINPPDCPLQNKAGFLISRHGAKLLTSPVPSTANAITVCVVANGFFDAAGVAFDEKELSKFQVPADPRPKIWLSMSREEVLKHCDNPNRLEPKLPPL